MSTATDLFVLILVVSCIILTIDILGLHLNLRESAILGRFNMVPNKEVIEK